MQLLFLVLGRPIITLNKVQGSMYSSVTTISKLLLIEPTHVIRPVKIHSVGTLQALLYK
jgi:hypothetical protein